jgi:hypothetical protein
LARRFRSPGTVTGASEQALTARLPDRTARVHLSPVQAGQRRDPASQTAVGTGGPATGSWHEEYRNPRTCALMDRSGHGSLELGDEPGVHRMDHRVDRERPRRDDDGDEQRTTLGAGAAGGVDEWTIQIGNVVHDDEQRRRGRRRRRVRCDSGHELGWARHDYLH